MTKKKKVQITKQKSDDTNLVFVYGTLKRGGINHKYLQMDGAEFVKEATIPAGNFKMLNISNRYPAVILSESGPAIHGEIYKVTKLVLSTLDILEGHKGQRNLENLFDRCTYFLTGENMPFVHIYIAGQKLLNVINGENSEKMFPEIPSGNWEIQKQ